MNSASHKVKIGSSRFPKDEGGRMKYEKSSGSAFAPFFIKNRHFLILRATQLARPHALSPASPRVFCPT
jgi:hypothetical protein